MKHRFAYKAIFLFVATACTLPLSAANREISLADYSTLALKDLQLSVKVAKADAAELQKINRDFGMAYRLRDLKMSYKEPNKVRLESPIGTMIMNGPSRQLKVPKLGLNRKEDLGESLARRYGPLDFGMITPTVLNAVDSKFLRSEKAEDRNVAVFEIKFKGDVTQKFEISVDTQRKTVVRRDWFDSANKQKASFRYLEPVELSAGLWIPTRLEVRNGEGIVAGVTNYLDLKINSGLDDGLFAIQ